MLRRFAILAVLTVLAVALLAPATTARRPIIGEMALDFQGGAPIWAGTVTIDGTVFDMEFYNTGTGKSFDNRDDSQSHFFEEDWYIYRQGTTDVVLSGYDRGVVSWSNSKYRMSGYVIEANDPFDSDLVGRRVHMSGVITFDAGVPDTAPGVFRIN